MYVPRILLSGDRKNFLQKIGNMKVDIIGQVSFNGAYERGEVTYFSIVIKKPEEVKDFQRQDIFSRTNFYQSSQSQRRGQTTCKINLSWQKNYRHQAGEKF